MKAITLIVLGILSIAAGDVQYNTTWFCALHSGDIDYNTTLATLVVQQAVQLGCTGIRTDIRWFDIEPIQGQWDDGKVAFYISYFDLLAEHALEAMPILSSAPPWAKAFITNGHNSSTPPSNENITAFSNAYSRYSTKAVAIAAGGTAERSGGKVRRKVTRIQLWNEANHIPSFWAHPITCILFNVSGAAVRATAAGQSARLYANVMADDPGWKSAVDNWLNPNCAGNYIDAIGVDHYPGTWAITPWDDWSPLEALLNRVSDQSNARWYGRGACVLETGFSSWDPLLASESDQATWMAVSIPAMMQVATTHQTRQTPARNSTRASSGGSNVLGHAPLELVSFYQLLDGTEEHFPPEEASFGVLRPPPSLVHKPAFAALKDQIAKYSRPPG